MQWLLSVFAKAWNRSHQLTGHVWGERFFSRIIEGLVDKLRVVLYIDDNPVKAHLVKNPWEWEYGGMFHHRMGIKNIIEAAETIIVTFFPTHKQLI
jgi:putative transposase